MRFEYLSGCVAYYCARCAKKCESVFTTTTMEASVDWKDAMSQRTMQIQLRKRRKDAPRNMKNPE